MKLTAAMMAMFTLTAFAGSVSLDEAKALSAKDGKPVLIDFYAVWCGPCKRFTADSKKDPELKDLLGKVHLVKLDAEKGGKDMAEKFNVRGYPTFVLANQNLQPIKRWWGYEKTSFSNDLNDGLADPVTLDERMVRFKKGASLKDAVVLAEAFESSSQPEDALKYFQAAEKLNDQDTTHYYGFDVFRIKHQLYGGKDKKVTFEELDQTARALLKSGKLTDDQPVFVGNQLFRAARDEQKKDDIAFYIQAVLKNAGKDDGRTRAEFGALKSVYIDNDVPAAIAQANQFFGEGWKEDPEKLNEFAWWCFENRVNMEQGRDLAAKAVSMLEASPDRANTLDTQAELENALGNPLKAMQLMEKAVQDDPRTSHKKQLERFRKLAQKDTGASGNQP